MFFTFAAFVQLQYLFIYYAQSGGRPDKQCHGKANGVAEMGYGSEWSKALAIHSPSCPYPTVDQRIAACPI